MRCEELLAALNDYVDGQRQSALCQAMEEHLAGCDPCQVVVDNIRQTITLYRDGQPVPLPPALHEQLRGLLRKRWADKFPGNAGPREGS
jgi:predicted anti-sigma-YlaC factor YlaD